MTYEIKGGNFPVVECKLKNGEKMITESGSMCWMDPTIKMDTTTGGGLGKMVGRMFTKESLFQNVYTSEKDDSKIAFGVSCPGSIAAIKLEKGQCVVCQKSAFLAAYGDIELSVFFNKKIGSALFGGGGFLMQKVQGEGMVFLEIDGSSVPFDLKEGEKLILSTGYLVSMSETCSIDIEMVKGVKNIFLGGEGLFNTVITGPGRVITQTMPLARTADSLINYLPLGNNNSSSNSTGSSVANAAGSIFKSLTNK